MQYRHLGSAGLEISALSLGAWVTYGEQVSEEIAQECMYAAYEAGVNFFDNAESYGGGKAEIVMGNVIKKAGWKRQELVVSTKIFWGNPFVKGPNGRGLSRKHILEAIDDSLDRLQLKYVDLVFCHRPDVQTPVEETVRAMNQILAQGKAFYWGTSEWNAQQIQEAIGVARREHLVPPQMEQPQYNMFVRARVESELSPLFKEAGLGTTIWSPLASGLLSGKYNRGIPKGTRLDMPGYEWLREQTTSEVGQKRVEKIKQLVPIADELGCSMAQLALAWCAKNPNVSSVITGASKRAQVEQNMKALDFVPKLTDSIMERIEQILQNKPAPIPGYK